MDINFFDVGKFREITQRVFDAEIPGFWSDWTPDQQRLYNSGDWKGFSRSRGYGEAEIEECSLWIAMIEEGKRQGYNPFGFIQDITVAAAAKNIALDKNNEILKSSHLPGFTSTEHSLTQKQFRDGIQNFESWMKNYPGSLGEDPFPLEHFFAKGLYVRKCTVPTDTLFVTKIHRYDDAAFLLKGDVEIFDEQGVKRVRGPVFFITKAGTKRIVYGHTESIIYTVHSIDGERDIRKIENEIFVNNFEELENEVKQCLE